MIKYSKWMLCCLLLFIAVGIGTDSRMVLAYTEPLVTNSGITYPISLSTGKDAKGKTVFDDEAFFNYIKQAKYETGKYEGCLFDLDEDGLLSKEECETVRILSPAGDPGIRSMKGVEAFPKLRELYGNGTGISRLDLSNNPRLQVLTCSDTPLATLNVSNCPLLKELKISGCQLACLDLSDNTALNFLSCQAQSRDAGEYQEENRYLVQLTDLDPDMDLSKVTDVRIDGVPGDYIHSGYDEKTGTVYCSDEMKQITYVYTLDFGGVLGESVDQQFEVTLNLTTGLRESYDTGGGTRVLPQFTAPGTKDQEPERPERAGYRFTGWYEDADCTSPYSFGNVLVQNKILYAGWEKKTYKVKYEAEGSDLDGKEREGVVDWWTANLIPTQEESPVRAGYTCIGWRTESGILITGENAASVTYGDAAGDSEAETTTLLAVWEVNTGYTLNLDVVVSDRQRKFVEYMPYFADGTVFSWNQSNILSQIWYPMLPGHQFAGWYTAKTGGFQVNQHTTYGEIYQAQFGAQESDRVPTLYGRFTLTSYTIHYDECGGSPVEDRYNVTWGSTNLLPLQKTKKKGYLLAGWKLDGVKVTGRTKLNQSMYAYQDSLTLKAVWYKKYETKGTIFKRYGCKYKVTQSNKKGNKVKLIEITKKKITLRNKVFYNGKHFKITSIQKKALKKAKKIRLRVPRKQKKKYIKMIKRAGGKRRYMKIKRVKDKKGQKFSTLF